MNSYYQTLVDQEIQRIHDMTTITAYQGHTVTTLHQGKKTTTVVAESAAEASNRENAARRALSKQLEESIAVDPNTGHARNLDFLAQHCRDIYELPSSPRPLEIALFNISSTISVSSYPAEDLQRIIDILNDFTRHARIDVCMRNEIARVIRGAKQKIGYSV